MIDPAQIPDEVAYEVFKRFEMDTEREAAEAIAAALAAWPGMTHMEPDLANGIIILPLPTEARDE